MTKPLTDKEFIHKANIKHSYMYDYSKVVYVKRSVPVKIDCLRCGHVFDQKPSDHLSGCGCPKCAKALLGTGSKTHGLYKHPLYTRWKSMHRRAEKRKLVKYEPWLDFQVFYDYCIKNGWKDGLCICRGSEETPDVGNYEPGNVYFASRGANANHALATKEWTFTSPSGLTHTFTSLTAFCSENGLQRSHMQSVHKGVRPHHKGWTK